MITEQACDDKEYPGVALNPENQLRAADRLADAGDSSFR